MKCFMTCYRRDRAAQRIPDGIDAVEAEVAVSAASAWEIGIKNRLGRLDGDPLLAAWTELLADANIGEVTIDSADAITAARLPWEHRDPFDRMLMAQAQIEQADVVTVDPVFRDYGVGVVW